MTDLLPLVSFIHTGMSLHITLTLIHVQHTAFFFFFVPVTLLLPFGAEMSSSFILLVIMAPSLVLKLYMTADPSAIIGA